MNEFLHVVSTSPQVWVALFVLAMGIFMAVGANRQIRRERAAKRAKAEAAAQAN